MAKGIAMVMWRGSSRLAQLIKYNIAQYKSVDELISDIGPEAIDLQTYDNDPTSLIPSHLPNELNTDESRYTKAQRARWFLERIGIVSTPMQLLDITQMQEKMLWMFLYQKGAQLPQSAYMEKFGVTATTLCMRNGKQSSSKKANGNLKPSCSCVKGKRAWHTITGTRWSGARAGWRQAQQQQEAASRAVKGSQSGDVRAVNKTS